MLSEISVENLRSIKDAKIEVAPITVLYGPNGSGKSTVMHALAILREIVLNPNQPIESFFNLGFASFGGFEQVVYQHDTRRDITLEMGWQTTEKPYSGTYKIRLGLAPARFELKVTHPFDMALEVEARFPYAGNQRVRQSPLAGPNGCQNVVWNGMLAQPFGGLEDRESGEAATQLVALLNAPIEFLRTTAFVHLKRGFSKPHYAPRSVGPCIATEDDVAAVLQQDHSLEERVGHWLDQVFARDFRVRPLAGTGFFALKTLDRQSRLSIELVNDGFGINQVVYLLAVSLRGDTSWLCIEDPEIHLHPTGLRNLARAFVTLAKENAVKRLIISTHSEHLVLALLAAVSSGVLRPDELACYLCTKEKGESRFERQRVNSKGQLEGGLSSFMEGELEDLKDLLGIPGKGA